MGMMKEFRDFAVRGNVVDMAVGVVIGGAFGKIISSLVENVIMPPIGMIMGGVDFSNRFIQSGKNTSGYTGGSQRNERACHRLRTVFQYNH